MKAIRLLRCASSSSPSGYSLIPPPLIKNHTQLLRHGLRATLKRRQKLLLKHGRQAVPEKRDGLLFLSMKREMFQGLQRFMKMAGKLRSALVREDLSSNNGFLLVEGLLAVVITILLVNAVSSAMTVFYQSDEHIEEAAELYDEKFRLALERGNGCDIDCRVTPAPTQDPL